MNACVRNNFKISRGGRKLFQKITKSPRITEKIKVTGGRYTNSTVLTERPHGDLTAISRREGGDGDLTPQGGDLTAWTAL